MSKAYRMRRATQEEEYERINRDWKGVVIRVENEAFTGLSYTVPGWECRKCGAQYGGVNPPSKCWKCEEEEQC